MALSGTGDFDLSLSTNLYPTNIAVFARSNTTGIYGDGGDTGVYGNSINTGVHGDGSDTGVYGNGTTYGVYGYSSSNIGVYGDGANTGGKFTGGSSRSYGVGASAGSGFITGNLAPNTSVGLIATAGADVALSSLFANNQNVGLYATAGNIGGRNPTAGYFQGSVSVVGTLTKSAGSFKIDHPLDPTNKYLYHSFVESPDMLNIYNGIATLNEQSEAIVEIPEWFEALNRDYRYQLTCLGQYAPVFIAEKINEGKIKPPRRKRRGIKPIVDQTGLFPNKVAPQAAGNATQRDSR